MIIADRMDWYWIAASITGLLFGDDPISLPRARPPIFVPEADHLLVEMVSTMISALRP